MIHQIASVGGHSGVVVPWSLYKAAPAPKSLHAILLRNMICSSKTAHLDEAFTQDFRSHVYKNRGQQGNRRERRYKDFALQCS
jgi:hypothetical protein